MSLLTPEGRITVKEFASPPEIQQPGPYSTPGSVSNIFLFSSAGCHGGLYLTEGCIQTKSVKSTHQLFHWVKPADSGDSSEIEYVIENDLKIVPYRRFSLEDGCNLVYLEASIHASLDLYAFVAITASFSTLSDLIKMVKTDNNRRQQIMDNSGHDYFRKLNFNSSGFTNPEYELVAIHPEHFLPHGSMLSVFHSTSSTSTNYVLASDQCLRKSLSPNSPSLPPFYIAERANRVQQVNIFLVILNAEIKFHRYLSMISQNPPAISLPADVLNLMHLTVELVNLLYWNPVPTKGSQGEAILAEMIENGEIKITKGTEMQAERRKNIRFQRLWQDMDQKTRKAYTSSLISGDSDYNSIGGLPFLLSL